MRIRVDNKSQVVLPELTVLVKRVMSGKLLGSSRIHVWVGDIGPNTSHTFDCFAIGCMGSEFINGKTYEPTVEIERDIPTGEARRFFHELKEPLLKRPAPRKARPRVVRMDGRNHAKTEIVVPWINLWRDYEKRQLGVVGRIAHGDYARLLDRRGDGCLIETRMRVRGWVTGFNFIREFRE